MRRFCKFSPLLLLLLSGCTPASGDVFADGRLPNPSGLEPGDRVPIEKRYEPNKTYSRQALLSFYTECMEITPYDVPQNVLKQSDKKLDQTVVACIVTKQVNPKRIEAERKQILQNQIGQ